MADLPEDEVSEAELAGGGLVAGGVCEGVVTGKVEDDGRCFAKNSSFNGEANIGLFNDGDL